MLGNVTALEGLHVTGKYRDIGMQHTAGAEAYLCLSVPSWAQNLPVFQKVHDILRP